MRWFRTTAALYIFAVAVSVITGTFDQGTWPRAIACLFWCGLASWVFTSNEPPAPKPWEEP